MATPSAAKIEYLGRKPTPSAFEAYLSELRKGTCSVAIIMQLGEKALNKLDQNPQLQANIARAKGFVELVNRTLGAIDNHTWEYKHTFDCVYREDNVRVGDTPRQKPDTIGFTLCKCSYCRLLWFGTGEYHNLKHLAFYNVLSMCDRYCSLLADEYIGEPDYLDFLIQGHMTPNLFRYYFGRGYWKPSDDHINELMPFLIDYAKYHFYAVKAFGQTRKRLGKPAQPRAACTCCWRVVVDNESKHKKKEPSFYAKV
jgi:hypothetical protein